MILLKWRFLNLGVKNMDCGSFGKNKYGIVVFGVPAFAPLVLHLVFLFDFDASVMNSFIRDYVGVFRRVFELKESNEVLVWGYIFSIAYLFFMLPFMLVKSKRVVYLMDDRCKMKAAWLLLAVLFFFLFFFFNFFDYSSASQKYIEALNLSFYIWPLFYFYFLFPLYLGVMFVLAFVNTEIK